MNFHPEVYPEFDEIEKIRQEAEKLKRIEIVKSEKIGKEGICEEGGNKETFLNIISEERICKDIVGIVVEEKLIFK